MRLALHAAAGLLIFWALAGPSVAAPSGPQPSEVIYPRGLESSEAAAAGSTTAAPTVDHPSIGGFLATAGYVVLLGVLVAGAFWLLKRGSLPRPFARSEGALRVVETRMLGNRQFLLVVEYGEARMLLGVCPGRIDYLTPLAGHPLMDTGTGEDDGAGAMAPAVAQFGGGR